LLRSTFIQLLAGYTSNTSLVNELWTEIEKNYSGKKRHYHNLQHLEHLLAQLQPVQEAIKSWDTVLFTLFYHDIIYLAHRSDNEAKSAALAQQRLQQAGVNDNMISNCTAQILATKAHQASTDPDTNYFTDADLSILGQPWEVSETYYKNVRKEYAMYPDFLYNPGRKKVLHHFLSMDRIFKTNHFFGLLEAPARANLQREWTLL
jgi:predicted metal-dependent HD superfamily phosphohydrolase